MFKFLLENIRAKCISCSTIKRLHFQFNIFYRHVTSDWHTNCYQHVFVVEEGFKEGTTPAGVQKCRRWTQKDVQGQAPPARGGV